MTTVAEIRDGKTCPGCASDCRHFINDADCCIYNTFISGLFSEVIEDESDKEVHYDPVKKKVLIIKNMEAPKNTFYKWNGNLRENLK